MALYISKDILPILRAETSPSNFWYWLTGLLNWSR
uniref:Uncharacterized protein n=1 Tax=Solanum lycopersicum TaxID=4081 RepID=K4D6C7_SOLLC